MMVRRIKNAIDRPFDIEGRLLSVDTSCGYAIYPEHSQKIDEIRIMADHRMYEDKTQNRKKGQWQMKTERSSEKIICIAGNS